MKYFTAGNIIAAFLLILSFGLGVWLSILGRPLNTVIFGFHKIIGVAALVYMLVRIYQFQKPFHMGNLEWITVAVIAAALLAIFITGILLSFEGNENEVVENIHKFAPLLAVASTVMFYIVLDKQIV